MFQRGRRNHEVGAVITDSGAEVAPAPRRAQIKGYDPLAVERQYAVQPGRQRLGKVRIGPVLPRYAAFDFADADDAEEKIGRSLPFEPFGGFGIALAPAQFRQRDDIDQPKGGLQLKA